MIRRIWSCAKSLLAWIASSFNWKTLLYHSHYALHFMIIRQGWRTVASVYLLVSQLPMHVLCPPPSAWSFPEAPVLRLLHTYDASMSISASTSISARKSVCEPGQCKHKCKRKKKKRFPSSYACACVACTFSCAYACAYACACIVRVNQPLPIHSVYWEKLGLGLESRLILFTTDTALHISREGVQNTCGKFIPNLLRRVWTNQCHCNLKFPSRG